MNRTFESHTLPKDKILDTAERLFALQGIDATSLRQITSEAGVNLAAVNYHFQSKDELVRAVYARRLNPMNEQRLALLDQLEAEHAPHPVPLEAIINAFYEPLVANAQILRELGVNVSQMMGRIYTEPHHVMDKIWSKELAHVVARFGSAYLRTLPHLSQREVYWRMHLSIGVLSHSMGAGRKLTQLSEGVCDGGNMQELLLHIKSFAHAGFSAPSTEAP